MGRASDRASEIIEQVTDLEAAAAELASHMHGLDAAVTDGFQQVFDVVRQRFHEAVEVLFPGGQALWSVSNPTTASPGSRSRLCPQASGPARWR